MTSVLNNWRGYFELTKPGVQALLFVSCASGMLIGSNFNPPVTVFFFGLIGISFLAASSAVVNHFFDKQIDAKMDRTSKRPLVMGHISDRQAILFSVLLYASGSIMLLNFTNFLTWLLTTLTFIFYGFIYTKYLKYMTSQNIVIGGLAGAMPPLLGWSAITNSIEPNALLLVLIIMVWTPPHFWALAVYRVEDYSEAEVFTKQHILLYTFLLIACTMLPYAVQMFGEIYLISALVLGLIFLSYSFRLYKDETNAIAMPTFAYSIIYLAALFAAMLIDHFLSL